MKVFFHTLGCKVNQFETEYMLESLLSNGFVYTEDCNEADLIVVNSCTVTAESDRKTRQLVRRYRRLNKNAAIALTGCMPQAFPKEAEKLPADIILGNNSNRDIIKAVNAYFAEKEKLIEIFPHLKSEQFESGSLTGFNERTRAYIKIEDGCDRGCTYCIIPKARGRVRSRKLEDIIKEASELSNKGFKELVLVGINLSSFGKGSELTLADAVEAVASVSGIERIRLGSLEPDLTDNALLDRLMKIPKFCPQFHLSLQSGCDKTLKRMNRLYNTEQYKNLVEEIRKRWNFSGITTDIMVGFIGEDEEEFEKSLEFVKEIGFLKAHIFPYSIREGTAAAVMSGRVDEAEKHRRAVKMADVCNAVSKTIMEKSAGNVFNVLLESEYNEYIMGYSENYTPVYVKTSKDNIHKIVKVKLIAPVFDGMLGEILA